MHPRPSSTGTNVPCSERTRHLQVSGLEMLASWYLDAVAAQHGAPLRNPDLKAAELARVRPSHAVRSVENTLDAVFQLGQNQRPKLVLASLFTILGSDT